MLSIRNYFSKQSRAKRVLKQLRRRTAYYIVDYNMDPVEELEVQIALGLIKSRDDVFKYSRDVFETGEQADLVRKYLDLTWPHYTMDPGPR